MIAPLRARHRFMVAILATVASVVFVLALVARPEPVADAMPAVLVPAATGERLATVSFGSGSFTDGPGGTLAIHPAHWVLTLDAPLRAPDVLAYWLPAAAERPGDGGHFLGAVSHGRQNVYPVPPAASAGPERGVILLWSLGHAERVAVIDLARIEPAGGAR